MKIFIPAVLFLFMATYSCKTSQPVVKNNNAAESHESLPGEVDFSKQSTWLLGYFSKDRLIAEPYSSWFIKGYDSYIPDQESMLKLYSNDKNDLTIKIVMGTWCPDSRREVPRFIKILDQWQFENSQVTFIGVDDEKRSPVGEYVSLNIERVPTFIIYKNKIEAGRIIENPVTSLEQDMVNILKNE